MKKEYENIQMKPGYKVESRALGKYLKFIYVYNWEIIGQVNNLPREKEPIEHIKRSYPIIGIWKLKTNKNGNE